VTHSVITEKLNLTNKQLLDLFMCVCSLHCAQLLHTVLHRTDLIIFPLTLQTRRAVTSFMQKSPHWVQPNRVQ